MKRAAVLSGSTWAGQRGGGDVKEYPTLNHPIEVRDGATEFLDGFGAVVPGAFRIVVNHVVTVAVLPELPVSPWPPPFPANWDDAVSREAALGFAFATTDVTIAPSAAEQGDTRTVRYAEAPESAHTAFWIPGDRFRALVVELAELCEYRGTRAGLPAGQLEWALAELLPHAELSDDKRTLLCLGAEVKSTK